MPGIQRAVQVRGMSGSPMTSTSISAGDLSADRPSHLGLGLNIATGSPRPGQYPFVCLSEPEEGRLAILLVDATFDHGPIRGLLHGAA